MATAESASRLVTRVANVCTGGGRSIPIDFASVARNTSWSALGKRCGSVRSVTEARPTGTEGRRSSTEAAIAFARAIRGGEPGVALASIERVVSMTTNASASVRTRCFSSNERTGCIAARPSDAAAARTAASGTTYARRRGSERPTAERSAPCDDAHADERRERHEAEERDEPGERRQELEARGQHR